MRKIHSIPVLACLAAGIVSGCAREQKPDVYQASKLEDLPFVYKMTVQQGNILSEEMIDRLEPGMNKRQVTFLLGTPLLTDFFHANRWDYTYTIKRGHQAMEKRTLTLYFDKDEVLSRIEGDIRPDRKRGESRETPEVLVTVPDYQERKGLVRRGLDAIGLGTED